MKWITSAIDGVPSKINGPVDRYNRPVNLELVENVTTYDDLPVGVNVGVYNPLFELRFHSTSGREHTWHYPDKLTRDKRLKEVMQYADAKTF